MWVEGSGWIATGVGAPVVAVFLLWGALVLHCDRRRWRPLDPLLVALLLQSVLHQGGACLSTLVLLFRPQEELWCSVLVWWLAAVRALQASTLTTLATARLFRVRYSHLIYHLVCLTMIAGCIGVAAVLARASPCEDSPDRRYVVFSVALHIALAFASVVGLICCCCKPSIPPETFVNNSRHRRRLLNSSSDLSSAMSDISVISTMRSRSGKGVSHSVSDCSARRMRHSLVEELLRVSPVSSGQNPPITFLNGAPDPTRLLQRSPCCESPPELQIPCAAILEETKLMCDLDASSYGVSTLRQEPCYISTSTSASSTNSRSPCLAAERIEDVSLSTIVAVLLLSYSINHIPVLGLTIAESFAPHLIPAQWPVTSIPLWAGLLEGVLLPIVLAMTDKAFVRRVAAIYSRRRPSDMTKPPQGMHGKFRPFNNCLLEPQRPMETVRFPITNGSLFTSLDGRIPIIHNYRRTKGVRTTGPLPSYHVNQRYRPPTPPPPSVTEAPHMGGGQLRNNIIVADINCDRKTESPLSPFKEVPVHKKEQVQCYTQRLNTSELRDTNLPSFPQNIQQLRETLFLENQDSEDSYEEFEETCEEPIYATLSSRSACSATTAANDDFEFYQQETPREPKTHSGFKSSSVRRRISRSSSIDRILSQQGSDEETESNHRPMYRPQRPPPRRSRLSRRPGPPPTPPPPRRLAPVLSVDSLVAALHQADVSYLDTGDLYRHGSVPDLKKVFYTGFL
ncbi:uncharacterized protein LOC128990569 [Macrosteles quadrilineatus]|uniref:uncharacterized protein LOC128990569 n=1 Tax=Macrosteles quadrilineatus TaxID=74068 RepID=UPI0023E19885|nr:uncharacterized protein LOC128990569 [Macrosteles quadrilineatus]